VIYNAPYDLTVLDRELRRHGWPPFDTLPMIVDPLVIDRALDRYRRGSRKLVDVCRHHGVTLSELDAHTAEGDAVAAARLAWKLAHRYPDSCGDLVELQQHQSFWQHQWAVEFEEYLRRQGKPDSISRDWPICPYVEQG
jgi:DNA polymerase-3 subunit epsilon